MYVEEFLFIGNDQNYKNIYNIYIKHCFSGLELGITYRQ